MILGIISFTFSYRISYSRYYNLKNSNDTQHF